MISVWFLIANIIEDIPKVLMLFIFHIWHDACWRTLILNIQTNSCIKTKRSKDMWMASLKRYNFKVIYQPIKSNWKPSRFSVISNFVKFCTNYSLWCSLVSQSQFWHQAGLLKFMQQCNAWDHSDQGAIHLRLFLQINAEFS